MIPIANVAQIRECDRYTIQKLGIPGVVLMENASRAVAAKAVEMLDNDVRGCLIRIFCGHGNNGGDGLAAARYLHNWGAAVEVYLLSESKELSGDALAQYKIFKSLGGRVKEVKTRRGLPNPYEDVDLVVDAVLGTGFAGTVQGINADAIDHINEYECPILAVDIPSGVNADTGEVGGCAVMADATVTFGLFKNGLLLAPGCFYAGETDLIDIGIPELVVSRQDIRSFTPEDTDARAALPRRHPGAHKGEVGHVYILAGSPGLTGAAALAAEAVMRTGAGLAVVGVPDTLNSILEIKLTEAMTQPLPDAGSGVLMFTAMDRIRERLEWAHTVVIGPGIGRDRRTADLLEHLLPEIKVPLVIDADGLNLLAERPKLFKLLPPFTVLTPHPGEFARMTGKSTADIANKRLELARRYASRWNVVLHLKGAPSLTVTPEGYIFINSSGNAGMATGGSGDVLTGIIASLLGQGCDTETATWLGAYLHGAAGDLAMEELGQNGMLAGDIIDALPATIAELTE